jgi:hypothetical protein
MGLDESFFTQTGRFAGAPAQEVELRPAHMCVTVNFNLLNSRRAKQERSLNANTIGGDTANGEIGLVAAVSQTDDPATHELDTLTLTFDDSQMNSNSIARPELRQVLIIRSVE